MGRRINGRFDSLKARLHRFVVSVLWIASGMVALTTAFTLGGFFFSSDTVEAAPVQIITAPSPILDRIALCESHNSQLNPNGQVLVHVNTNGTVDIGRFQINSIHEAEATKLGFDLFTDKGNTGYANWLYANRGTSDWQSSQHCWGK